MIEISMKEFIQAGRFGAVDLGASREIVLQRLGDPDDCSVKLSRKNRKPVIYKYGGVELYLGEDNDAVEMILIDDFETTSPFIDLWILDNDLEIEQAESELNRQGIDYRKEKSSHLEGYIYLICESGVYMLFVEDENKAKRLGSVSRSRQKYPL
jgi:hypothetical protein